jgi:hypothetical protein
MVRAVVQQQIDHDGKAPAQKTYEEHMECLDSVHRMSQMPHETSQPGSSYSRLSSETPQLYTSIPRLAPAVEPDSSLIDNGNPAEVVSFYTCVSLPQRMTI